MGEERGADARSSGVGDTTRRGPSFAREWVLMARSAQARGLGREMHVNILTTLWQRKWLFTLIAGSIVLLIVGVGLLLEERYTAETQVLVESREQVLSDIKSIFRNLRATDEVLNSEAEIIASDSLTRKVMSKLGLYEDPEFNTFLRESDLLAEAIDRTKQLKAYPRRSGGTKCGDRGGRLV